MSHMHARLEVLYKQEPMFWYCTLDCTAVSDLPFSGLQQGNFEQSVAGGCVAVL